MPVLLTLAWLVTVGIVVLTQHRVDGPVFSVFDDLREIIHTTRLCRRSFSVHHALEVLVPLFYCFALRRAQAPGILALVACVGGEHVVDGNLAYELAVLDRLQAGSAVERDFPLLGTRLGAVDVEVVGRNRLALVGGFLLLLLC